MSAVFGDAFQFICADIWSSNVHVPDDPLYISCSLCTCISFESW